MPYRLIARRIVLEVIETLTISIQSTHADGEKRADPPQRREGRKEEKKDTDLQDLQDSEDSENPSGNPVNP
jgi:hypothetical protein